AMSSQGQIFRGELPGNLVGSVSYGFTSSDEYGNTGSSSNDSYTGSYGPSFQAVYGTGTSGAAGGEPSLTALSVPFAGSDLFLALSSGASGGTTAIITVGSASAPSIPIPGLLVLNVGGIELVTVSSTLDANGDLVISGEIPSSTPAGLHLYAQGFVLDNAGGDAFASSKGLDLTVQ
ncbi:MAG: hypothetical protein AAF682_25560, partial [Planctomycetota bacterium]